MALTSGIGPHYAWLNVSGSTFLMERGTVTLQKTRESSEFSCIIPMSTPNAEPVLAGLGDNSATITVLTRGVTATLITGQINITEFDYTGGYIRVHGIDASGPLHTTTVSKKYVNQKGSEIVQDLVGMAGINIGKIDTSKDQIGKVVDQDTVKLTDNTTLADAINKVAQFDGAKWWIDNNGAFQYRIGDSSDGSSYSLNYKPSLATAGYKSADFLMLKIRRDIEAGKEQQVKFSSWSATQKELYQGFSKSKGRGGPRVHNLEIPGLGKDQAQRYADSYTAELDRHELRLHATVVGDPTINIAQALQVNGTQYWDVTYEMDTIVHDIGMGGHITNITARGSLK